MTTGMGTATTMGTDMGQATTTVIMDMDMDTLTATGKSTITITYQGTAPATGMALMRKATINPRTHTCMTMDRTARTVTIIRAFRLQRWEIQHVGVYMHGLDRSSPTFASLGLGI